MFLHSCQQYTKAPVFPDPCIWQHWLVSGFAREFTLMIVVWPLIVYFIFIFLVFTCRCHLPPGRQLSDFPELSI